MPSNKGFLVWFFITNHLKEGTFKNQKLTWNRWTAKKDLTSKPLSNYYVFSKIFKFDMFDFNWFCTK